MTFAACSACAAKLSARSCSIFVAPRSKGFLLFVPCGAFLGRDSEPVRVECVVLISSFYQSSCLRFRNLVLGLKLNRSLAKK